MADEQNQEDSDYELVSREELSTIRKDVSDLRKQGVEGTGTSVSLIEAMDRLAGQINRLVELFEHANKEMYEEYSEGFHDESEKLDTVITQNEKIARGVLAVADLLQHTHEASPGGYPLPSEQQAAPAPKPAPKQAAPAQQSPDRHRLMNEFS